ncbi:MAG TPA: hypothetical protein VNP89_00865 [Gaiellaceae bacterium]|nr:hypothetical protein [Gaiellaceae bacterium]
MRKILLTCAVALAAVAPAQAGDGVAKGRELKISGPIVNVSSRAVSVENAVGDAVLTCAVPERLADKAEAFKAGDKVRMHCVRYRGRRAQLVKLERLGERAKRPEKPAVAKQEASGPVVELGAGAIVVQSSEGRLACRVPEEKQAKLEGLKLGDKVKIWCAGGMLAGIERYHPADKPAGDEVRIYGSIAALSRASVTVTGEAGSMTCAVPAGLAEKVAGRFAVGDRVKMMCRGSELTYLERTA